MLRCVIYAVVGVFLIFGCKDNATEATETLKANEEFAGMAVRAVNTGSGDLEIEMDNEAATTFCYEGESCGEMGGGSFHMVFEGKSSNIDQSLPDKKVVGVKASFHVTKGNGKAKIISGRAYRDDAGFLEFEEGDVLYTSDSFKEGDIVTFEYGDTGN